MRSAVLYADEVELVSPVAEYLASLAAFAEGKPADLVDLLTALDDDTVSHLSGKPLPPNWREIFRLRAAMSDKQWDHLSDNTPSSEARASTSAFNDRLTKAMEMLGERTATLLESAGADEIVPAFQAGIVTISPTVMHESGDASAEQIVHRYVEKLRSFVGDPNLHLLLDEFTSTLIRHMIDEGEIEPSRLAYVNAGQAAVGSGLIARLPAFDQAPIDELLDLRNDLDDPLSRYRHGVADLADKLKVGPFDLELQSDIDNLYRSRIEPALADLREGFAEHGLVRETAKQLATDVKSVAMGITGPVLALGSAPLLDLNTWLTVLTSATPAALTTLQATARAAFERQDRTRALERHDLFYLMQIERRVGGD